LVLRQEETIVRQLNLHLDYGFPSLDDWKTFQESLRGMDLLDTFEFDKVRSKRKTPWGEATKETLKLWRSRDPSHRLSLSFYASNTGEGDLEFSLPCFERKITTKAIGKLVLLKFRRQNQYASEHNVPHRLARRIARRYSFKESRPPTGHTHFSQVNTHDADNPQSLLCPVLAPQLKNHC
jgi:hypothetical protein